MRPGSEYKSDIAGTLGALRRAHQGRQGLHHRRLIIWRQLDAAERLNTFILSICKTTRNRGELSFVIDRLERRKMNALAWTRDPVGHLQKYAELGRICFGDVGRFEECDQVWAVIGIVLGVICVLTLVYIARHFYREYAGYRRVRLRRLAELEVAPLEVMNEYVWSGEKALDSGLSQEEMIQRIKDAKARQLGDAASDKKPTGDPTLGTGIRHR